MFIIHAVSLSPERGRPLWGVTLPRGMKKDERIRNTK